MLRRYIKYFNEDYNNILQCLEMSKEIKLTRGRVAIVDDKFFSWLNQWQWHLHESSGKLFYAARACWNKQQKKSYVIFMQREILHLDYKDPREVLHRNFKTLDNRFENIRVCSHSEHQITMKKWSTITSSRYKGVSFNEQRNKWEAYAMKDYKKYRAGFFEVEIDAAKARDKLALELFGDIARLNFDNKTQVE